MGATGRNKGEWKPQQRLCEEPTVPQSLCSLHLDPFCASAAQLRTGNYKMNARTQGERCLLGKSTCDGVLLWLLTEIELKLRGDVTLKDRSSIHAHCISTSAHQGFLPFCELKTTRFHHCPRPLLPCVGSLSTNIFYSQEGTCILV